MFAPSINTFCVIQVTILATARIASNTTRFSSFHVTNVEQHKLFGIDTSRPLLDVTPNQANLLAVAEGVQSRFFHPSAAKPALKAQS